MRDYIPKSCGLPNNLANQVMWLIRDYERMKVEYDNAVGDSPGPPDGQPRGSNTSDPTSREGVKRAELFRKLQAIEQAKLGIPYNYMQGVWDNILYKTPYPETKERTTWWRYKARFMYKVAENLFWV